MRESCIEKRVKDWAKKNNILPLKMSPFAMAGYPDDIFLYEGRCVFVEFKAPGKKPRPLQEARIRELKRRGFPVGVIDDLDQGIAFLGSALLSRTSG